MDQTIPSKMFQKVAIFMVLLQEGFFFYAAVSVHVLPVHTWIFLLSGDYSWMKRKMIKSLVSA